MPTPAKEDHCQLENPASCAHCCSLEACEAVSLGPVPHLGKHNPTYMRTAISLDRDTLQASHRRIHNILGKDHQQLALARTQNDCCSARQGFWLSTFRGDGEELRDDLDG